MLFRAISFTVFCILLTSCTSSRGSALLRGADLPRGGEEMAPGVLDRVRNADAQVPVAREEVSRWFLPAVTRKYRFEVSPDGSEATASHYSMIALGVPYAYLPLSYSFSKYRYTEGEAGPAGAVTRRYLPFWSWDTESGAPGEGLEADVQGAPLLFEAGAESGPMWYFEDFSTSMETRMDFSFWSGLWYLGPVYFDSVVTEPRENAPDRISDGQYFFPLFLGRTPGALLWMSFARDDIHGAEVTETRAHGPLAGYAGWYAEKAVAGPGEGNHLRMLLGGLLWYDSARGAPGSRDRVAGPLWGLFGGGARGGDPAVYLLRVPVTL